MTNKTVCKSFLRWSKYELPYSKVGQNSSIKAFQHFGKKCLKAKNSKIIRYIEIYQQKCLQKLPIVVKIPTVAF